MNLAFNELSFRPFLNSSHSLKKAFFEMLKKFKNLHAEYGISHLVFPNSISATLVLEDKTIFQWLESLKGLEKSQVLSFINRKPFINDLLKGNVDNLDAFTFFNEDLNIEETYCIGLGFAYLQQTASLSLNTNIFWRSDEIKFTKIDSKTLEGVKVAVPNISAGIQMNDNFRELVEANTEVILVESKLSPHQKPIHFRDDHGQDILKAFAERLANCIYVNSVINSIRFNAKTIRFIRKIFDDGKIEIVLHWEDAGYGMVVQTTGSNYRETKAIAEILKNMFDK